MMPGRGLVTGASPDPLRRVSHRRRGFVPNVAAALRAEISRVARKEAKALTAALRKQATTLRKDNAAHKQARAKLERRVLELERIVRSTRIAVAKPVDEDANLRFSPARLKRQRERLGLSAADFGALVGCSGQSIYLWESGKTRPRKPQLARIAVVRSLGKREAQARLAALTKRSARAG
jgi:DNA-binding transcriptional regulator YiaG